MTISLVRELLRLVARIFRITCDYVRGYWAMRNIEFPIVSILGGLHVNVQDEYSQQAFKLAKQLAEHRFSIITGGGPGIMVAANCGAASACSTQKKANCKTLGISLYSVNHGFENPCAHVYKSHFFFIRKWFLIRHSIGFVFFPGGIGTVDELFELLNLVIFNMLDPKFIILVEKDYWQPLLDWYVNTAMKGKLITLPLHEVLMTTNNADEALTKILTICHKQTQVQQ